MGLFSKCTTHRIKFTTLIIVIWNIQQYDKQAFVREGTIACRSLSSVVVSPEIIYTANIIWSEQVIFNNTHTHSCANQEIIIKRNKYKENKTNLGPGQRLESN